MIHFQLLITWTFRGETLWVDYIHVLTMELNSVMPDTVTPDAELLTLFQPYHIGSVVWNHFLNDHLWLPDQQGRLLFMTARNSIILGFQLEGA